MPNWAILERCAEILLGEGQNPPQWIPAIPRGHAIVGRDGRKFQLDNLSDLMLSTRDAGLRIPVDENHASTFLAPQGGASPALGWVTDWTIKSDGILWAQVEWTPKGSEVLKNKEYRYVSPAILHDKDGRITGIHSLSLVNRPNLDLPAINSTDPEGSQPKEDPSMEPKEIRLALGLPETATEDEVKSALIKLKAAAAPSPAPEPIPALNADQIRAIVAESVQAAVAPLVRHSTETHDELVTRTIDSYVKAGKIQPTEIARNHYFALCATPAGLKSTCEFLDQAPALVSTNSTINGDPPAHPGDKLSAIEREVCRKLQIPEDEYLKTSPEWMPSEG